MWEEKNAWKKVEVFVFVFKDVVVKLRSDNIGRMFLEVATCAVGGECGKELMRQVCLGGGGWAGRYLAMCWRMWWYHFGMRECGLVVVKHRAEMVG
jgi:hypothetical protein